MCTSTCNTQHGHTHTLSQVVTWISDPMHGNTETVVGYKTRRFDNIRAEIEAFFDVHESMGSVPGGVHVEMTGVQCREQCREQQRREQCRERHREQCREQRREQCREQ